MINFNNLFKKGKTVNGELLFLKFKKNNLKNNRFCFVVGLKISKKAAIRNKIKRQLRAVTKGEVKAIKQGIDIAVIAKPEIIGRKYREIKETINQLFESARIYQ